MPKVRKCAGMNLPTRKYILPILLQSRKKRASINAGPADGAMIHFAILSDMT